MRPVRWLYSLVIERIAIIGSTMERGTPMALAKVSWVIASSGAHRITAAVARTATMPTLAISQKPARVSNILRSSTLACRVIGIGVMVRGPYGPAGRRGRGCGRDGDEGVCGGVRGAHAEGVVADPAARLLVGQRDLSEGLRDPGAGETHRLLGDPQDLPTGASGVLGGGVEKDADLEAGGGREGDVVDGREGAVLLDEVLNSDHGPTLAATCRSAPRGQCPTAP